MPLKSISKIWDKFVINIGEDHSEEHIPSDTEIIY